MSANAIDLFAGVNVAPPTGNGQVLIATGAGTAGWSNTIGAGGLTVSGGVQVASGNLALTLGNITTALGSVTALGVNSTGNVDVTAAGQGLRVAEGSNAKQGTAILAAGTVIVSNTAVTANSRIVVSLVTLGTVTVPSAYGVSARVAGTSFTILASQATDTSTVWYEIFEPG